ncbi:MAG TPA: TolC family outer membrane protein [Quisquiliibacterium sp.]|nr:TolC family outer membrane protein [Quisquiliibacterium sp.]
MAPRHQALASAVALALAALPGAAAAMDLIQAYRDASAIDPVVSSSRSQLAATREKVPQARAGLLPSINASWTGNRFTVDTSITPSREFSTQNYSVALSYPLLRLQNVETFEQSKLSVAIAEAQLAQAEQDLIVRVSQAYFDVLAAQDNVETIRAQKRAITEQLASAKRNFEVGTATVTDQQEAQSRYDLAQAQEFVAQNDLEIKRAALAQLTGRPLPELKVLRPGVTLQPPQPAREAEWTSSARENNFAVQQAQVATEISKREIEKQRYGHYPTVDLVGSTSYAKNATTNFTGVTGVNTGQGVIGLQVNIPIYAGGAIDARVREAANLRDKSLSDLDNARRAAEQGARSAFLGVNSGLAQVKALEAAERSSQLALDSNLLGYQVGVRINIDVLNAQQQLFTTRRDLARARYDVLVNGLRLKSTAAALTQDDLRALDALLTAAPAAGSSTTILPTGSISAPTAAPTAAPAASADRAPVSAVPARSAAAATPARAAIAAAPAGPAKK